MNVRLAETAGFCYGVEQAVNAVYAEIEKNEQKGGTARRIYTYGPIVHNDTVTDELAEKGVRIIDDLPQLRRMAQDGELDGATVIIRAHGVGRDVMEVLERKDQRKADVRRMPDAVSAGQDERAGASVGCPNSGSTFGCHADAASNDRNKATEPAFDGNTARGVRVIDATCPFVKKIHKIVREAHDAGEHVIVTGSASHPEVVGILGQIGNDAVVIESAEEAMKMPLDKNVHYCIVSQTTFHVQKFQDIVDILRKRYYDIRIVDTICNATQLRQKEAMSLSRECDVMIVIGGKHSSNTAKLFDICSKECSATYFIESLQDFTEKLDSSVRCVGITAGASTPKTIIQEVLSYVRDEF